MSLKKNLLTYVCLAIFEVMIGFILITGIWNFGNIGIEGKTVEYPFLTMGAFLIMLLLSVLITNAIFYLITKFNIYRFFSTKYKINVVIEIIIVLSILLISGYLRILMIKNFPLEVESDYKTYYTIAEFLGKGTLSTDAPIICEYISRFSHVIGYPYVLSKVFSIVGKSVLNGLYFGVFCSILCEFFIYKTVRYMAGRIGGIAALAISAFLPSQIMFSNFLASEPLFSCMLFGCFFLFTFIVKKFNEKSRHLALGFVLYIILGILLALTSEIRPMAQILLIAIAIVLSLSKIKLKKTGNDVSVALRGISKGWICVILMICSYLLCSSIVGGSVERTIEREVASSKSSYGYNLLVGLNIKSQGGWNKEDADLLQDSFDATGSATDAQLACKEAAIERLKSNPIMGSANLLFEKFALLWKSDDNSVASNIISLNNQETLTESKKEWLYSKMQLCNGYYLAVVFWAGISGIYLWFRKGSLEQLVMILLFIGTAVLHMVLESQPRYHYYGLQVFSILAAVGIAEVYKNMLEKIEVKSANLNENSLPEYKEIIHEENNEEKTIDDIALKEAKIDEVNDVEKISNNGEQELTKKVLPNANSNSFNMVKAIEEGHITVTVTPVYKNSSSENEINNGVCVEKQD